jgi:hypothetical protein
MATVQRIIRATPDRIFAVLADGWTYSDWVVGTAHVRDVDEDWPATGSKVHHKSGPWPLSLQDTTTVVACEPQRSLILKAGLWPLGQAQVHIDLVPRDGISTAVTMTENFEAGPLLVLRNKINDLVLHRRNIESLRRLADIAEREQIRSQR